MKYLLLSLIILLSFFSSLSAQAALEFGVKAGLHLGNVDEVVTGSNGFAAAEYTGLPTTTTARPQVGVWLAIPVSKKLNIQPELLWSRKILKYQSSNPDLAYTRFDYLSLPLLLTGNLHPNWCLELGPEIGYLLNYSLEDPTDSGLEKSPFIEENSVEIGTNFGISYQQDGWSFGARYYRSLSSVQTFDFFELSGALIGTIKQYHQGVTLWLGYEISPSKS